MPKVTFENLKPEKKEKVLEVLKKLFQEKPFQEVTVKEIIEELDIPRGSFYQYFENLEDAYFEILNQEIVDIHKVFIMTFQSKYKNLEQALNDYGVILSEVLFDPDSYMIYRNSYIYWDENLNQRWMKVHDYNTLLFTNDKEGHVSDFERMNYLKGIIHSIIKRNYKENWSREEFIEKYKQYVKWIIGGIS